MNFLQALQLGIGMSNSVLQLVHQVEGPGNGDAKKRVVMNLAMMSGKMAFETANNFPLSLEAQGNMLKQLDKSVDNVVEFYNQIGVFQKTREITVEARSVEKSIVS